MKHVVLTMGANGAALCHISACQKYVCIHHMPALPAKVANLSGAGDCLVAGMAARLMLGDDAVSALAYGLVGSPHRIFHCLVGMGFPFLDVIQQQRSQRQLHAHAASCG